MSETWPSTISTDVLTDGFNQQAKPNTIRSSVDAGIDKVRRRYTTPIKNIQATIIVDFTQYQTLETFYNTTLQGGVLSFNFPDPATETNYEHRFLTPPSYTPYGPLNYQVRLDIERIT